jgi:hypothetical protein
MRKFKHKEELLMFSDEILEKIFSHPDTSKVSLGGQSTMIHVIEEVLEERGVDINATVSNS